MKTLDLLYPAPYADVNVVGIPRALLFFRYGVLWQTFFEKLGRKVCVSEPSDRATLEMGDKLSVDECCLASKLYMGHVGSLVGSCDAIFVPRYASFGPMKTFCTKFQALPDLVRNTFAAQMPDTSLRILSVEIDENQQMSEKDAFVSLGLMLGATKKKAKAAYEDALEAQRGFDERLDKKLRSTLDQAFGDDARKLRILVVAHPYVSHDPYVGKPIVDLLAQMDVVPVFADHFDRRRAYKKSKEFSATLPWMVNRELVGATLSLYDNIDGIVLVSAFPCGPDSMANDAIMRYVKGRPILSITVDAQSGLAGLETRIESFVDILRYQRQGGYTHVE